MISLAAMRHIFNALQSALLILFLASFGNAKAAERFEKSEFELDVPAFFVKGVVHTIELKCLNIAKLADHDFAVSVVVNGARKNVRFVDGTAQVKVRFDRNEPLSVKADGFTYVRDIKPIPLWMGILPPLLVILLALIFKEVVSSLILGVFLGAAITGYYAEGMWGVATAFFRIIDTYIIEALMDQGHLSVIVFSVLIGGLVAVISKNGGMHAIVTRISSRATNPQRGQLVTWSLGIAIFFDDYANTLVVGNTMRPLTDKLRISREKLSYIVDSTAAPVAAIALITTWIGAELGYIQGALSTINTGVVQIDQSAYAIFLGSLQYAFYPVLALIFILLIIWQKRDFGPMYEAEKHARIHGVLGGQSGKSTVDISEFEPADGVRARSANALIPIAVVVLGTVAGLLITGYDPAVWGDGTVGFGKKLSTTIGQSDSYKALLWASMSALIVAILLTVSQGIMRFTEAVETSISGFKTMINAVIILILAWSLAFVTEEMHTADYLASLASDTIPPWSVPAITFLISSVVAFSTGSAWGTMAIVYPLMLPLSWELSMRMGLDPEMAMGLFYNVTSSVLAGAVLGDHCSPISDTTILSSLATQCDHMDHVRTQIPYAITVGLVAVLLSILTAILPIPWYLSFPIGIGLLFAVVRLFGKRIDPAFD
jgi:Na+/H+ antiporter NhaC